MALNIHRVSTKASGLGFYLGLKMLYVTDRNYQEKSFNVKHPRPSRQFRRRRTFSLIRVVSLCFLAKIILVRRMMSKNLSMVNFPNYLISRKHFLQ